MSGMNTVLRYARALYEAARDAGALTDVAGDMQSIARILDEAPEIRNYCMAEEHPPASCAEFVELAFIPYIHDLTGRMLRIATENGRLAMIPLLPDAFDRVRAEESDVVSVLLETVQPADDELLQRVRERMNERLNMDIELKNQLNADLVGGFRILWRDRILDNSAIARLHALGRQMGAIA